MVQFFIFVLCVFLVISVTNLWRALHPPKSMDEAHQVGVNYYKTQTLEWELFHYVYSTTNYEGERIPDMVTPDLHVPGPLMVKPPTEITPADGARILNEHLRHFGNTDPNEEYADHEYE